MRMLSYTNQHRCATYDAIPHCRESCSSARPPVWFDSIRFSGSVEADPACSPQAPSFRRHGSITFFILRVYLLTASLREKPYYITPFSETYITHRSCSLLSRKITFIVLLSSRFLSVSESDDTAELIREMFFHALIRISRDATIVFV